jgi:isopenicillin-N epimerase
MKSFRKDFTLEPKIIYLNSGSLSISPKVVTRAVNQYTLDYEKNPTRALFETWGRMWNVQKQLAAFFHARAEDLFLRSNITEVLNDLIFAAPLKRGDEILTCDLEYGAIVNILKYRAHTQGFSYRQFSLWADPNQIVAQIESELRPRTKMLLLSHVITGTGLILPIEKIAQMTRKRGILLCVDGAHAPGAIDLDFRRFSNVDFYGGNLHKWMMGPKGTSLGWVNPIHQKGLNPQRIGWTTFETPEPFRHFGEGNSFAARWMISACSQFAPFFAVEELLNYWKQNKPETIRKKLYENQYYLEDLMTERVGWVRFSPERGQHRGPLLSYHLPKCFSDMGWKLMEMLYKKHAIQIVTPPIRGEFKIRFAPHVFNSKQEIRTAVGVLEKLTKRQIKRQIRL